MTVNTIGLILIPVSIFVIGGIVALIRGAIRFAQYMVRSEEAQTRTADSVGEISERLSDFMKETGTRLGEHNERLAVVEWEIGLNGSRQRSTNKPH